MTPAGYIVLQHAVRLDRPVRAYDRWVRRIPAAYRSDVLRETVQEAPLDMASDPNCLALLRHYRSLMPMAQEARKPIFHLRPADGAIGSHFYSVQQAADDFLELATNLARVTGVRIPAV